MNEKIQKFVNTAGMYVGKKARGKIPPAVQLDRILNQIERITKLAYVSELEKQEGLNILWGMYTKVQSTIDKSNYTEDESWGNAKVLEGTKDKFTNEPISYYGDAFESKIAAEKHGNKSNGIIDNKTKEDL